MTKRLSKNLHRTLQIERLFIPEAENWQMYLRRRASDASHSPEMPATQSQLWQRNWTDVSPVSMRRKVYSFAENLGRERNWSRCLSKQPRKRHINNTHKKRHINNSHKRGKPLASVSNLNLHEILKVAFVTHYSDSRIRCRYWDTSIILPDK